jgi:hypothetical protein
MARPERPGRNRKVRSFRQLRRFRRVINSDKVFGTHSRPEEWRFTVVPQFPFALLSYGGDHETRFAMTSKSWISRLSAPLIAFVLIVAPSVSPVRAVEDARKVSVVSFGLFGDQGVFRSEATGAAQVVAGRFGSGPINVQFNSKKGGRATIETLAMSLQVAANGMDAENDVLFLILTSHGSPAGLAVKAGRLTQTLTPSNLADMLARTGVRHKVVVISGCYSGVFIPRLANPDMP